MAWTDVGDAATVRRVGMVEVEAAGRALLLLMLRGAVHAIDAVCPHNQAWFAMGRIEGDCIACPRHQGLFDITTGEQRRGPACPTLGVYPVRVQAGRVQVALAGDPEPAPQHGA